MKTIVYPDYPTLSAETAGKVAEIIKNKPNALLCFPAGDTALGTFAELLKLRGEGNLDFSECKIVGLDEWIHLGAMKNENCFHFLKKHLFDRLGVRNENLCFFNGESTDLRQECLLNDHFVSSNGGIDLMLLGVGMNGHIGLNEPGTSFDTYSHVVELDEVTKQVGKKYFSTEIQLSRGITLGMKHVIEAKTLLIQLSGKKKLPIVKRLIGTEATPEFPVSLVKQHTNALLLLDDDAYPF